MIQMESMWYFISPTEPTENGTMTASIQVPPTSLWFSGHFPGFPVLPGIAQLAMAADTVRQALGNGVRVAGFRRVRFKRMIRPGDDLVVVATALPRSAEAFAFRIMAGEDLVCSGTIDLDKKGE